MHMSGLSNYAATWPAWIIAYLSLTFLDMFTLQLILLQVNTHICLVNVKMDTLLEIAFTKMSI